MGSLNLISQISFHLPVEFFFKNIFVSGLFDAAGRLIIIGSQTGPSSFAVLCFFKGDLEAEFP
jgi:hypothetical protein